MPRIALIGDVMLGRSVARALATGDPADVWSPEVQAVTTSCDAVVLNLECCISDRGAPTRLVRGKPFFFRGPPAAIGSLQAIGASCAGLANNHALDYGPDALLDTLALLDAAGIATAGAGPCLERARRGAIVAVGALRLGIVAAADDPAEFAAGAGRPGIAFDRLQRGVPEWLRAEIGRLRGECDLVLAFLHWGPNMSPAPNRWQLALARELTEAGADALAGHSAHVFHGVGWSGRGPLLYDLGDALDDYAVDPDLRNDLGTMAIWSPGADPELELVGLALDFCHTRLAKDAEADWIADRLGTACGDLGTEVERASEQRFLVRRAGP